MGNILTKRRFKRYVFDSLVMENIVQYLRPSVYHLLNRRYRVLALMKLKDKRRLFNLIVSSDEDRDDILDLLDTYEIPNTISVRYWNKYGRDSNIGYMEYKNINVQYYAVQYLITLGNIQDRNKLISHIINMKWNDHLGCVLHSDDLDIHLSTLIRNQDYIPPRLYLHLVRDVEHIKILSRESCNWNVISECDYLYRCILKERPDLITYDMTKSYEELTSNLGKKLEHKITENKRLIRTYRPLVGRYYRPTKTYIRLEESDTPSILKSKIAKVDLENRLIKYYGC